MILTNYWDYSSQELIKCFDYYGFKDYLVVNTPDLFSTEIKICNNSNTVVMGGKRIDFSSVKIVWNRRFSALDYSDFYDKIIVAGFPNFGFDSIKIKEQLRAEFSVLLDFLYYNLKDKVWYPGFKIANINKMIVLQEALNMGLKIPKTQVLYAMENLDQEKRYISKSMFETAFIHSEEFGLMDMFTRSLDHVEGIPDRFFPSLVQEKVNKKYEIRTFFIDDEFYSMVIFSQIESSTVLDFRANGMDSCRLTSFKLPDEIEEKLSRLFKVLQVRTGSLDMIYSDKDEFVLLEINPIGQYGMTSEPCNYNLDFKIAKKLIDNYRILCTTIT